MAKAENVNDDYTMLSEMSESVILFARIVERSEKFTVAQTSAALYTIPNDCITSVRRLEGEYRNVSEISVKQDAKIVQKTLVSAAQIAGIQTVARGMFVGGRNRATDCQCPAQCCNQCSGPTGEFRYQVVDPATGVATAFGRALR